MSQFIKKCISVLLVSLLLSSFTPGVFSAEDSGEGSSKPLVPRIEFSTKPSVLAANYLSTFGVILNKSENLSEYNIYSQVTRREMLKIVINLSGTDVPETCEGKFSDMDNFDWGCKYAEIALKKKFISPNSTFRPNDSVTEAEALKMIMIVRGISRNQSSNWQFGYSTKATEIGLIDFNINYNDTPALRRFVFLTSARTYSNFNSIEQSSVAEATDIFDTIGRRSRFSILARLIEAAGAVKDLEGTGPFTFFAPTDYAFSQLPAGSLQKMLDANNINELREIIAFHFVDGDYSLKTLNEGIDIEAISGNTLIFSKNNDKVIINDTANITSEQIKATNGSIYRIDAVIFPSSINKDTMSY
ncbi:hypothetical protein GW846_03085 [Candidatus Gracilibacteria bacterium]|nr:hypothetical protein [Candidatus Gracilibacteria bacterium]